MVIRMRQNRSQTKKRRSHHGLKAPALSVCSHCGANHRPHHMCLECGYYNGRQVMDLEAQKQQREARMKAKRDMIRAQEEEQAGEQPAAPNVAETPAVPEVDDSKAAKEENLQDQKPEKKPE